jgi:hypothetical protein
MMLLISEQLRQFDKILNFIRNYCCFNLKAALFVEKRKNKFAHELKKNKFVFN